MNMGREKDYPYTTGKYTFFLRQKADMVKLKKKKVIKK